MTSRENPVVDPATRHVDRGFDRLKEESFEEALKEFHEAVKLDVNCTRGYYGRGFAQHRLGQLDGALSDYDKAIQLDPRLARAFLNRGNLRMQLGEVVEAMADYGEAIRLSPDEPHAYRNRARAWLQQGKGDEAQEDMQKALELESTAATQPKTDPPTRKPSLIFQLLRDHFAPGSTDDITITEREFPFRVRADLQRAMDRLFTKTTRVVHFCGVKQHLSHQAVDFSDLITPNPHQPAVSVPPQYDEVDIGEDQPVRCLKSGLWLLEDGLLKFAVLLAPAGHHFQVTGLKFQIATPNTRDGTRITQEFFKRLEDSVLRSESYRGKILSLEVQTRYSGKTSGLLVHRLRDVSRNDVILPRKTLDLLDRNVIDFTRHRSKLAKYGLSTKKGLLFYGPPGTGKTHTIHYLAKALEGHTTFLISAEQVGLLGEYMTLARLLQPSVVVMEDVDLIARDRNSMDSVCEEVLLNKLLNEMDGLRPDCDVLFILTTNRPESLERALASRPGRVDQAIEFPLPDDDGREKLIRLYSQGLSVPEEVIRETVKRTEKVSASFIKELMRRAAQFQIERGAETPDITQADIDCALDELLFSGGSLNRKLLGAEIEG